MPRGVTARRRPVAPPLQIDAFTLGGGLDLVTPALSVPTGRVMAAVNYEPTLNGYHRIDGIERFDGKLQPSKATYWLLAFEDGSAAISEDDTVTGATSGATAVALYDGVVTAGSYDDSDASGHLVLVTLDGTFEDGEDLQVSASTKCTANGTAIREGAGNDTDNNTWLQKAIETARTAIGAVPGGGQMRGVWFYKNNLYAFRDDDADTPTECRMYKSSSSGWGLVDLGRSLAFTSGGTTEIAVGDTITGATSSATATVTRVIVASGTWAAGDAAGRLFFASQTGTFQAENLNVGASSNLATIAGNSAANTLLPSGRFEIVSHNFYGASDLLRMYGCDGVNQAFEFDGTVFSFIQTGMTNDKPKHIAAHKEQLFLLFPGGSLQNSAVGLPQSWSVVLGAGEIGIGQEGTGLLSSISGVLVVLGATRVLVLYGNDKTDFQLTPFADDAGGIEWTAQAINTPIYLDNRGIRSLSTTQAFGDFKMGTLSLLFNPLLEMKRRNGKYPVASVRVRAKDQYRLFFDDGTGVTLYFGKKTPEALPFDLGRVVRCICSSEDDDGNEVIYFGSDDGYIYQLDAGTSCDGEEIQAYLRLAFNHHGSPERQKSYKKVTVELDAAPSTQLFLTSEFSYANPDQPPVLEQSFIVGGGGGFWDQQNWNEFYWSSPVKGRAEAFIDGIGNNISTTIASRGIYEPPHTLHGVIYRYQFRGLGK